MGTFKLIFLFVILIACINAIKINHLDKSYCTCGIEKKDANGNILSKISYPWLATVRVKLPDRSQINEINGMAIVLNNKTLLTAASVLYPFNNEEYLENPKLYESDNFKNWIKQSVSIDFKGNRKQIYNVDNVIIHPNYTFINENFVNIKIENDIALIFLEQNLHFNNLIKPVCLDITKKDYYDDVLTVAGFRTYDLNKTEETTDQSYHLELKEDEVLDKTKTDKECKDKKDRLMCLNSLTNDKFKKNLNLCSEYSGTGVHYLNNGKQMVIAVASIDTAYKIGLEQYEKCTNSSKAYKIYYYLNFIRQHINDEFCT